MKTTATTRCVIAAWVVFLVVCVCGMLKSAAERDRENLARFGGVEVRR